MLYLLAQARERENFYTMAAAHRASQQSDADWRKFMKGRNGSKPS